MRCHYCHTDSEHTPGCPNLCTLEDSEWAISIYRLGRDRGMMGLLCPPDACPTYRLGYHYGKLLRGEPKNSGEDQSPGA
jgi:hypothetical protein